MIKNNFFSFLLKILFICSIWVNGSCVLAKSLPIPPVAYVNDSAQLLSLEQKNNLEKKLEQFEKDFGTQIGVIIVPSLQGESIESYAHRVGDHWKLGRKNIGDGLLFIIALEEHRVRIDVNRALEGAIPDVTASRILNEAVIPAFKTEHYYLGIIQGLDRIFACIKNENLPKPDSEKEDSVFGQALWDQPWIAIIFIGWVATMMLRQLLGRKKAAPIAGLVVGSFGTFVMQSIVAGIIIAVIAVSACMLIPDRVLKAGAKRTQRIYRTRRRRRGDNIFYPGYGGDGNTSGHGGGHGPSGGMGGGAGSGGGGDSGGGGASGSW